MIADQDDQIEERRHGRKPTTFINKLYQDDDEFNDLKVHGLIDEDDAEVVDARNEANAKIAKRKTKANEKASAKKTSVKKDKSSRIGKLSLKKDSLAMFAICEVTKDYLIVNHTRNTKGYIPLTTKQAKQQNYRRGQLVIAQVNSEVGGATTGDIYNFKSGKAGLNRKVQLTMDLKFLNKMLDVSKITKNMILMAQVESKEAKGYILDLGLKDKAKGFLKTDDASSVSIGQHTLVIVKSVVASSKVIKCDLLSKANNQECVQQPKQESNLEDEFKLTVTHLKPGFLVSCKVSKVMENGLEINFLGGLTGTVFQDHIDPSLKDLKVGSKFNARIIGVDLLQKKVTLSTLKHIVEWDLNGD